MIPLFERHRKWTADDLAQILDGFELLPFVFIAVIEDEKDISGVTARSPEEIILMAGNRGWQSEPGTEEIDRAGFAVILAKYCRTLPIVGRKCV